MAAADARLYAQYQEALRRDLAALEQQEERGGAAASGDGAAANCTLLGEESDGAATQDCTACHRGSAPGMSHPVDVDYESAQRRPESHLRPLDAAVSRGAFLPGGKIRCVTCHDRRSPWKYRLAIPAGAEVRPAVDPHDPRTYEDGPARSMSKRGAPLPPRTDVGRKPLCTLCHSFGD